MRWAQVADAQKQLQRRWCGVVAARVCLGWCSRLRYCVVSAWCFQIHIGVQWLGGGAVVHICKIRLSDRLHRSYDRLQRSYETRARNNNFGGLFLMMGKISDVRNLYYFLVKNQGNRRSLLSRWWCTCGPWVSVCHPPAAVLHGRLIAINFLGPLTRTCSRWRSIPIGSPSPPSPQKKSQLAVLMWKTKVLVQGESNPSLPRPSTLSRPPPSSSNPTSCRRSSLHPNQDCAIVWLIVAPATAHEHPD